MIKELIKKFLNERFLFNQAAEIDEDASLIENGLVDSLGVLEIVGFIEEQFQLEVQDEDLTSDNLDSVNKIVRFVERKMGA